MNERSYSAKVLHVVDPACVEIRFDLGFGVKYESTLRLADVDLACLRSHNAVDQKRLRQAKHCLIILVSGKKSNQLLVRVPEPSRKKVTGVILLRVRQVIDVEGVMEDVDGAAYLNVNRYMAWLEGVGFDASIAKGHLNAGKGNQDEPDGSPE